MDLGSIKFNMIEKELKILLTEDQYKLIKERFNWSEDISQINFYYGGNSDSIKDNRATVRIRGLSSGMMLQVKMPVSVEGAVHVKKEFEKECNIVPYKIDGSTLCKLCSVNDFPDVYLLGHLYTERLVSYYEDNNIIFLDKSVYLGKTDYELEIEFNDTLNTQLLSILEGLGLTTNNKVKGKFGRFMERYKGINSILDN
ncbi:CYTH domain-containing protein [Herbinix luporum]|jgi:uncharacterized protein YjbK|uniref:CYTH domain-containing protein n=1 Tax=Herbinix luporum TaxID=1679721 RepID=A0A0K8J2F0_9FIRM|nr:CYTH domain-containing protein [Herbinix luporum]MDI9488828.1 CYTH domain-containing protein [Bacillota bacterium]CUH91662.1 hypothetical protein SD1D_0100 [Herbinix luporum]HHT56281.1 CYTH domain-containing protein [Herbinix luporum]